MTRMLSRPVSVPPVSLDEVQHFVFEDADWDFYETMLRKVGNRPIQMTYDQGRLELISPLPEHERPKRIIGKMIDLLCFELDQSVVAFGSTTFRRKDKGKGLEPDECYYFRDELKMRRRKRLNLEKDPPPELVVEIDITTRWVPREPIYAALGVPEIWRWDGQKLECLHLKKGQYRLATHSLVFPFLEPRQLAQFIEQMWDKNNNSILREFLNWARKKAAAIE